jgi:hypothetical protein
MMAEIHREEAGGGAESGTEADGGRARGQLNRCAVKGGEVEREHRRAREQEKEGRADEGEGERETWRGGGRESELSRKAEGNGAATGLRYRHMGGREGEGRVSRRGGDKVGNHAESEEPTQGGTRCWGGGKGILRNKNQQNQDGDESRVMLPEKSNQGRTGRSPKKVSLDTPRKCEPMSEGNLSATLHRKWPLFPGGKDKKTKLAQPPPSLPAEKEKEKITVHRPKIEWQRGDNSGARLEQ